MAYADDTQLLVFDKNLDNLKNKVENVIDIAQKWYTTNRGVFLAKYWGSSILTLG